MLDMAFFLYPPKVASCNRMLCCMIIPSTEGLVRQANFMSHVSLLLEMVSPHQDDLEMWEVDEIKAGTVARITKLATDAYIEQHNKLQQAEKHKTTVPGAQAHLVLAGASPLPDLFFEQIRPWP